MIPALPHRIMRERIDIEFFACAEPLTARKRVEERCTGALSGALDAALSVLDIPPDELVSIDRLEVNVTGLTEQNLERELVARIISALNHALLPHLSTARRTAASRKLSVSRSVLEEVCFFLEHGFLPWPVSRPHEWQLQAAQVLSTLPFHQLSLLISLLADSRPRLRFARHFSSVLRSRILPQLWSTPDLDPLLEDVEILLLSTLAPTTTDLHLRDDLIAILLEHGIMLRGDTPASLAAAAKAILARVLRERPLPLLSRFMWRSRALAEAAHEWIGSRETVVAPVPRASLDGSAPTTVAGQTTGIHRGVDSGDEPIFINNAGLVILAPYLPTLFAKLELADDREIVKDAEALALTHYLTFGSLECSEWDLVLGKILCGVPLEQPVRTPSELLPEHIAEANALLREVIRNWPALKNTSVEGLRQAFLQRNGILTHEPVGWKLQVERKPPDILLNALPWTISMIRLPWMECMLTTEWA